MYFVHNLLNFIDNINIYGFNNKENKKRVLLLGDGFFARGFLHEIDYAKYDITQIYRDEFINPQDIFYNLQRNKPNKENYHFRDFFQPKIKKIKEEIKSIQISDNSSIINNKLYRYDYLLVGLGSQKSLKSWSDEINNLIDADLNNIKNIKNIAIVGLGPVGLELGIILNKNYKIDMFDFLNHDKILSYVNPYYKKFILESMTNKNINIKLGGFYNSKDYNHDKVIFCVGTKCNNLTKNIKINNKLQMIGYNNVYIGGDCIDNLEYVKNAQCAYQQGVYVAKRLNGTANEQIFEYKSKGTSLNVGDKQILIQNHDIIPDGIYPDFLIRLYSVLCI
jgi:NADH dehydrogenase FAD-containing subunit